jgi:polysaccharide biosynthesis/export protein
MPNSMPRNRSHVDVFGSSCARWIKWILVAAGLAISAQAKAEYRVNVGDVLEVAVAGVPELRYRAPVQMDGDISLPLVGTLPSIGPAPAGDPS